MAHSLINFEATEIMSINLQAKLNKTTQSKILI